MLRDGLRARAAAAGVFPLALFLYLASQARFFGRWLLPAYPVLALLAAPGVARSPTSRGACRHAPGGAAAVALLAWRCLAAAARRRRPHRRGARPDDTRQIARDWLVTTTRQRLRIVIEPAVPARYYRRPAAAAGRGRKQFVRGFIRDISGDARSSTRARSARRHRPLPQERASAW